MARWPSSGSGGPHAPSHAAGGTDELTPAAIAAIPTSQKGAANGVASLGADSKVPEAQLPASSVDTASLVVLAPATAGRNTVQPTANIIPLLVKGIAGQTADLQQWQDSAGILMGRVGSDGSAYSHSLWTGTIYMHSNGANAVARSAQWHLTPDPSAGSDFAMVRSGVAERAFFGGAASSVGLRVRGFAAQSADLQQWQSDTGSVIAAVGVAGDVSLPVAGRGVVVKSPDGLMTRRIGIDNTGAVVATAV